MDKNSPNKLGNQSLTILADQVLDQPSHDSVGICDTRAFTGHGSWSFYAMTLSTQLQLSCYYNNNNNVVRSTTPPVRIAPINTKVRIAKTPSPKNAVHHAPCTYHTCSSRQRCDIARNLNTDSRGDTARNLNTDPNAPSKLRKSYTFDSQLSPPRPRSPISSMRHRRKDQNSEKIEDNRRGNYLPEMAAMPNAIESSTKNHPSDPLYVNGEQDHLNSPESLHNVKEPSSGKSKSSSPKLKRHRTEVKHATKKMQTSKRLECRNIKEINTCTLQGCGCPGRPKGGSIKPNVSLSSIAYSKTKFVGLQAHPRTSTSFNSYHQQEHGASRVNRNIWGQEVSVKGNLGIVKSVGQRYIPEINTDTSKATGFIPRTSTSLKSFHQEGHETEGMQYGEDFRRPNDQSYQQLGNALLDLPTYERIPGLRTNTQYHSSKRHDVSRIDKGVFFSPITRTFSPISASDISISLSFVSIVQESQYESDIHTPNSPSFKDAVSSHRHAHETLSIEGDVYNHTYSLDELYGRPGSVMEMYGTPKTSPRRNVGNSRHKSHGKINYAVDKYGNPRTSQGSSTDDSLDKSYGQLNSVMESFGKSETSQDYSTQGGQRRSNRQLGYVIDKFKTTKTPQSRRVKDRQEKSHGKLIYRMDKFGNPETSQGHSKGDSQDKSYGQLSSAVDNSENPKPTQIPSEEGNHYQYNSHGHPSQNVGKFVNPKSLKGRNIGDGHGRFNPYGYPSQNFDKFRNPKTSQGRSIQEVNTDATGLFGASPEYKVPWDTQRAPTNRRSPPKSRALYTRHSSDPTSSYSDFTDHDQSQTSNTRPLSSLTDTIGNQDTSQGHSTGDSHNQDKSNVHLSPIIDQFRKTEASQGRSIEDSHDRHKYEHPSPDIDKFGTSKPSQGHSIGDSPDRHKYRHPSQNIDKYVASKASQGRSKEDGHNRYKSYGHPNQNIDKFGNPKASQGRRIEGINADAVGSLGTSPKFRVPWETQRAPTNRRSHPAARGHHTLHSSHPTDSYSDFTDQDQSQTSSTRPLSSLTDTVGNMKTSKGHYTKDIHKRYTSYGYPSQNIDNIGRRKASQVRSKVDNRNQYKSYVHFSYDIDKFRNPKASQGSSTEDIHERSKSHGHPSPGIDKLENPEASQGRSIEDSHGRYKSHGHPRPGIDKSVTSKASQGRRIVDGQNRQKSYGHPSYNIGKFRNPKASHGRSIQGINAGAIGSFGTSPEFRVPWDTQRTSTNRRSHPKSRGHHTLHSSHPTDSYSDFTDQDQSQTSSTRSLSSLTDKFRNPKASQGRSIGDGHNRHNPYGHPSENIDKFGNQNAPQGRSTKDRHNRYKSFVHFSYDVDKFRNPKASQGRSIQGINAGAIGSFGTSPELRVPWDTQRTSTNRRSHSKSRGHHTLRSSHPTDSYSDFTNQDQSRTSSTSPLSSVTDKFGNPKSSQGRRKEGIHNQHKFHGHPRQNVDKFGNPKSSQGRSIGDGYDRFNSYGYPSQNFHKFRNPKSSHGRSILGVNTDATGLFGTSPEFRVPWDTHRASANRRSHPKSRGHHTLHSSDPKSSYSDFTDHDQSQTSNTKSFSSVVNKSRSLKASQGSSIEDSRDTRGGIEGINADGKGAFGSSPEFRVPWATQRTLPSSDPKPLKARTTGNSFSQTDSKSPSSNVVDTDSSTLADLCSFPSGSAIDLIPSSGTLKESESNYPLKTDPDTETDLMHDTDNPNSTIKTSLKPSLKHTDTSHESGSKRRGKNVRIQDDKSSSSEDSDGNILRAMPRTLRSIYSAYSMSRTGPNNLDTGPSLQSLIEPINSGADSVALEHDDSLQSIVMFYENWYYHPVIKKQMRELQKKPWAKVVKQARKSSWRFSKAKLSASQASSKQSSKSGTSQTE